MNKLDEENSYIRNIIKEILRECAPKKIPVNKNFVTYYTKLHLLDPNWGISNDIISQRANVQNFVKYVITELSNQKTEKTTTLKMQFYFSCIMDKIDLAILNNRHECIQRLLPLKYKITKEVNIMEKGDFDKLYRLIVYYIALVSGMGDPTKRKVNEEIMVALKSILQDSELTDFSNESKAVKDETLLYWTKIVTGIRLFNRDCDKGGEGIEDLPSILRQAIEVVKEAVQNALVFVMDKVNTLTTVVDRCYVITHTRESFAMVLDIPNQMHRKGFEIEKAKDLLVLFRQYELLLRNIIEEIDNLSERTDGIIHSIQKVLQKIHGTVYMKIAIPVDVIFPLFEQLSNIWTSLQDQVILLSRFNETVYNLEIYSKTIMYNKFQYEQIIGDTYLTDAERLEQTAGFELRSDNKEVEIINMNNFANIDTVRLQYLGFCCWKLVECNGALIPGNPGMGIVKYKEMYFVFSTPEACMGFCKRPRDYVFLVLELARRKPQLINFLQIEDQMKIVHDIGRLVEKQVETAKICLEKEIQTDDHIDEGCKIDYTYRWNIWDLKRQALNLANISKCQTHSTQTHMSFFRKSIKTQLFKMRHVEQQTKKDNYTNVPTPSTFIYGLRGRKDDKQFKIDVTQWES